MSILRDLAGNFMPHFHSRRSSGALAAANAEIVHDLDGDSNVLIYFKGTGSFTATYSVEGSPDGTTYYPLACYPYAFACVGGTLPSSTVPLTGEAVSAATIERALCAAVGGLRKIKIRLSSYTSGTAAVSITSDTCPSLSPYADGEQPPSGMVSATAAAGIATILTIPSATGLRLVVDSIQITRIATAALIASATPVIVTTANLSGSPSLTFGSDAAAQGTDKTLSFPIGERGVTASLYSNSVTVTCPATANVIWRANATYSYIC